MRRRVLCKKIKLWTTHYALNDIRFISDHQEVIQCEVHTFQRYRFMEFNQEELSESMDHEDEIL